MSELVALVARIRAAFPDLTFERAILDEAGADHLVVVLDDRWLFRFPRTAERCAFFAAELDLLARLGEGEPVAVPRYRFVPPARDFGGYAPIAGRPLRPALFEALPGPARERILGQIASLLRRIHALPPSAIARGGGQIAREWTGGQFRDRWLAERRAAVAAKATTWMIRRMDRFYDALAARPAPPREVVTHGDLTDDHMLLSPAGDALAGVIDFGDVCLGDPAWDLAFFFAYGASAARRLAELYDPAGADPTLLDRALWPYTRFRIEQLGKGAGADPAAILAELNGLATLSTG